MARELAHGGTRRGAGRKRKRSSIQAARTTSLRIDSDLYGRLCEFKTRIHLSTNNAVAEYLLNLSDAYDQDPLER